MPPNCKRQVPKAMCRPTAAGAAVISVWPDDGGTRISRAGGLARRFTNEQLLLSSCTTGDRVAAARLHHPNPVVAEKCRWIASHFIRHLNGVSIRTLAGFINRREVSR